MESAGRAPDAHHKHSQNGLATVSDGQHHTTLKIAQQHNTRGHHPLERKQWHRLLISPPSHAGDMTLAWDTWGTFRRKNRGHNARGGTGGGHHEA